ncbi:EAL domain-containing protein [Aliikangiella sp. IMCC44653]
MQNIKQQCKVLLINNDFERLETLSQLLESEIDCQIVPASDAESAISFLKTTRFDLIISNINLGRFDGWKLARLVRSGIFNTHKKTPYIIIANTWCEHIATATAREFGVNALISYENRHKLISLMKDHDIKHIKQIEKPSLLVIEDNPDTLELVTRILQSKFQIDSATNGETGLELWRTKNYSLVLLDVMLPGMSGNKVLQQMMQETPSQSVVIMTANHTLALAEELMLAGAADFVTKPFKATELRQVCESATRRDDFIISNAQFADKVNSLKVSKSQYMELSEAHQQLLDRLGSVIIELDNHGCILFLSKAWEKLTGLNVFEALGKPLTQFMSNQKLSKQHNQSLLDSITQGDSFSHCVEFQLIHRHSEHKWVEAKFEINLNAKHQTHYISGTIDDISERKKAQQELEYMAMHDSLTGLFNRHFFETELRQFSATAAKGNGPHCLLYIDLDHFKVINDTLGHHRGDSVLKTIAELIQSQVQDSDILARIGGDEFAVLLANTTAQQGFEVATQLCENLTQYQFNLSEHNFSLNCSIGITEISGLESQSTEYMKQADIALYAAKRQGRNLAHVFDKADAHSVELQDSLEWSRILHQAVADDNLALYFQPIIEISSGKVAYYEALVRLTIDNRIVSPGEFIPALEREGHMNLLDQQVIRTAIKYLAEYPQLHKVSINLSAQGFSDERLVPLIKNTIKDYQVCPTRIIFELTESDSLTNIAMTRSIVSRLSRLGCEFSIDDFGTGFSTFNYLKQLPAQSVKIDGSFIVDLTHNPVDLALVKAILEVANALGKTTVAEFVENQATLELLTEIGITYAQGYHLGKPQPIESLAQPILSKIKA